MGLTHGFHFSLFELDFRFGIGTDVPILESIWDDLGALLGTFWDGLGRSWEPLGAVFEAKKYRNPMSILKNSYYTHSR